jgi:fumarate reductase flavoprotein subunit
LIDLAGGLDRMAKEGWVKISDEWREIAKWIKADQKALKSTIVEYNSACDLGLDPIFAKNKEYLVPLRTPPYYAIRSRSIGEKRDFFLDTYGGIKVNERMEVIDKFNNPIKGLYASGVVTGGWEAVWHDSMLSGNGASFAMNSGRIAAENACRFI